MAKKYYLIFLLIVGLFSSSVHAIDYDNPPKGMEEVLLAFLYMPAAFIPINIYIGATHKEEGKWSGYLGGGLGVGQIAAGALIANSASTQKGKWIAGTAIASGVLNIGAGIYAKINSKPRDISLLPAVETSGNIHPGLTFGANF